MFAHRGANRHDDTLAWIHWDVAARGGIHLFHFRFFRIPLVELPRLWFTRKAGGRRLYHDGGAWQLQNSVFNSGLKRWRQRDCDAVKRMFQHPTPHRDRELTATVNDGKKRDFVPYFQQFRDFIVVI